MVGVFFGSFDPPHIGHVNIVTAALNSGIVDKVIVVPAYKSVWKNTETKWEYRLTMAKETFDNIPGVVVDGIEYRIANGEPLPTYKTIEAIKEIYGEFIIVTSADNFYQIINNQFGTIVAPNDTPGFVLSHQDTVLGSDCVYLKGEWIADPLDFLNVEQPKSYFY